MGNSITVERHCKMFYHGFPSNGYYVNCLNRIHSLATQLLIQEKENQHFIAFDFDNTLVYTRIGPHQLIYPEIPQITHLMRMAHSLRYIIFIITSRKNHENIILHCKLYNLKPNYIFTVPNQHKPILQKHIQTMTFEQLKATYQSNMIEIEPESRASPRKKLYLAIGDQPNDIVHATHGIKVPDPTDMNAYYVYNSNKIRI